LFTLSMSFKKNIDFFSKVQRFLCLFWISNTPLGYDHRTLLK
jgi:hypothetical protein